MIAVLEGTFRLGHYRSPEDDREHGRPGCRLACRFAAVD